MIFVQVWDIRSLPWCNRTKSVWGSLSLLMDVVQVKGTWGSQVRLDEIRASVGDSGSPSSYR